MKMIKLTLNSGDKMLIRAEDIKKVIEHRRYEGTSIDLHLIDNSVYYIRNSIEYFENLLNEVTVERSEIEP